MQSQRYVREKDFQYVTPPEIAAIPEALELYEQTMAQIGESYDRLAAMLKQKHTGTLMAEGLDEKAAARKAEKWRLRMPFCSAQCLRHPNGSNHERPQPV